MQVASLLDLKLHYWVQLKRFCSLTIVAPIGFPVWFDRKPHLHLRQSLTQDNSSNHIYSFATNFISLEIISFSCIFFFFLHLTFPRCLFLHKIKTCDTASWLIEHMNTSIDYSHHTLIGYDTCNQMESTCNLLLPVIPCHGIEIPKDK